MKKIFLALAAFVATAPLVIASGAAFASTDYTPVLVKQFDTASDTAYAVKSILPVDETLAMVGLNNGDVWLTDGTADGTTDFTEAMGEAGLDDWGLWMGNEDASAVANGDGTIYFWGQGTIDGEWNVWTFDGTTLDQLTTVGFEDFWAMYWLNDELYAWARSVTSTVDRVALYQINPTTGAVDEIAGGNNCDVQRDRSMTAFVNGKIIFGNESADDCNFDLLSWDPASPATAPVSLGAVTDAALDFAQYESRGVFEGELYFSANHVDFGAELWATDGTLAGTRFIKDIATGTDEDDYPEDGNPGSDSRMWFTEFAGELYFAANNPVIDDYELFKTDGTTGGTVRAVESPIEPGDCAESPGVVLDGKLYTDFDCTMGVFDGTSVTLLSETDDMCWYWCVAPIAFDNHVFYVDYIDGENAIWVTDGTVEGTSKVTSFGSEGSVGDNTDVLGVQLGSRLLFGVTDEDGSGGTGEIALYAIDAQDSGLANTGAAVDGLALAGLFAAVAGAGVYAVRRRVRA